LTLASFAALSAVCESAGEEVNNVMFEMLLPVLQLMEKTLSNDV
jgi:hypothetical protein